MLDIQFIRNNPELVREKSKQKGYDIDVSQIVALDEERRHLITKIEELRAKRNSHADQLKASKPSQEQIELGKQIKAELSELEAKAQPLDEKFFALLKSVPNMPIPSVPVGLSEDENVVIKVVGEQTQFDFESKNHAEIA